MKQATFSELRNHAKQYFDIVESGESVRIMRNGKAIFTGLPEEVMAKITEEEEKELLGS